MGLFDLFKRNKSESNITTPMITQKTSKVVEDINPNIDPIYRKKLSNGFLPGEIILLEWINGKTINENFPGYFEYTYGINAKKSAFRLVHEELSVYASPTESLPTLKVPQLKEILKTKGLKVSGNKKDLIERVNDNFSFDEISNFIDKTPLKLTTKGQKVLNEFYYIVPAHKYGSKDGVYDPAEAIKYVKNQNYKPTNSEISWALFQKAFSRYQKNFNFGLARNVIFNMAEQLYREQKYEDALDYYLRVFIYDLSGLGNSPYLDHPKHMFIAPGLISKGKRVIESFELNQDGLKNVFNKSWDKAISTLPFHYLDAETCYKCLLASFCGQESFIKKALKDSYNRIDKNSFEKTYNIKPPINNE